MKGGIAVLNSAGSFEVLIRMPTLKIKKGNRLDLVAIRTFFLPYLNSMIVIEKAQAMPKQGVVSMFNFGMGFGKLQGVLAGLEIDYAIVRPQVWKKLILKGTPKDKQAAIYHCKISYPEANLIPGKCRVEQDGLADALCIADYCYRSYKNGFI